jgi:transposase
MRGTDLDQSPMFSYLSPEQRVPADHPLRKIREMTNEALARMSDQLDSLYKPLGRRSIPPEKLLRALLLQVLFSVRSERMLMEQLDYNLLFRWFVGLNMDDAVWDPTTFSKNRDRFLRGDVAQLFFCEIVEQLKESGLISSEHFSVDGTLLEAWAGMKSYQKKEKPPENGSGSRGQQLLRDTHESTTDPEACLYRKSRQDPFRLGYLGHVLMENRNGLPVAGQVTTASPKGELEAAIDMAEAINGGKRRVTLGADKAYDDGDFINQLREINITPHIQKRESENRRSHLDGRTTRHPGYEISLGKRKLIESIFGWLKTTALMRKLRHRGQDLVQWMFILALSGYNLVRGSHLALQCK